MKSININYDKGAVETVYPGSNKIVEYRSSNVD